MTKNHLIKQVLFVFSFSLIILNVDYLYSDEKISNNEVSLDINKLYSKEGWVELVVYNNSNKRIFWEDACGLQILKSNDNQIKSNVSWNLCPPLCGHEREIIKPVFLNPKQEFKYEWSGDISICKDGNLSTSKISSNFSFNLIYMQDENNCYESFSVIRCIDKKPRPIRKIFKSQVFLIKNAK